MKIRVLHVIDHLGYGGAPMVVKSIVERTDAEKIQTLVCTLRTNPRPLPVDAELVSLACHKVNPFAFLALAGLCRKRDTDIVHAHLQKSIVSSLLASYLCDSKIIIHEHGAIFRGGTGCVYRWLLRRLHHRAARAIANSQATKRALHEGGGFPDEAIDVVSNFIDLARFDPTLYDPLRARRDLGIDPDRIVVGFVGRLDVCKGADVLLEAAQILGAEGRRFRFVIVGDGAERARLEEAAARLKVDKDVIFAGLCENPAELMVAFDIGVIPSRREAFGITAIEFMHMGVPVVAAPVGGLVEHVRDKETGLLLPRLDAAALARAVRTLAHDEALRQTLIQNARAYAGRFDGTEQIRDIERIYAAVAGR